MSALQREVVRAGRRHRELVRQMFELYAYEFSAWTSEDVDDRGRFTPDDFLVDGWRRRGGVGRYLLRVDGRWAGFAFVERGSYVAAGASENWLMEEFFVLRRFQGCGHGEWFARQLLSGLPGTWEIGQIAENVRATGFWRAVLGRIGGEFHERWIDNQVWTGPVQVVVVPAP